MRPSGNYKYNHTHMHTRRGCFSRRGAGTYFPLQTALLSAADSRNRHLALRKSLLVIYFAIPLMNPTHGARYFSDVSHMANTEAVPARCVLQRNGTAVQTVPVFLPQPQLLGARGCTPVPWAALPNLYREPRIKPVSGALSAQCHKPHPSATSCKRPSPHAALFSWPGMVHHPRRLWG